MGRLLGFILFAIVAAGAALAWTFTAAKLEVAQDFAIAVPAATPPAGLSLHVLHTGDMRSRAALAYRGGAFGDERTFAMSPVLVQHPQGALLIDSGFGRNVDEHFLTTPFLMQVASEYRKGTPVADQLQAAGFDPTRLLGVLLTHAHWDHVSGIDDLRRVPVWLPRAEREYIESGNPTVSLIREFGDLDYRVYDFADGPYLGFDRSFDFFKDGSVVLVPAPGHTPGSVIVFVSLADGRRYAFIGDLAWQGEGVAIPAERPWPLRRLIGENDAAVRHALVLMHRLQSAVPNLTIVPAHDQRVMDALPRFQGAS